MGSMNYVNGGLIGVVTVFTFFPHRLKAAGIVAALITGFATLETAKESFQKGVFDFIAKPFKLTEIQEVVTKAAAKIRGSAA